MDYLVSILKCAGRRSSKVWNRALPGELRRQYEVETVKRSLVGPTSGPERHFLDDTFETISAPHLQRAVTGQPPPFMHAKFHVRSFWDLCDDRSRLWDEWGPLHFDCA